MSITKLTLTLAVSTAIAVFSHGEDSWQASPDVVKKFSERSDQFNYDEEKIPSYTLTEPLVVSDGSLVTSAAQWNERRRDEILDLFRNHVYGHRPEVAYEVEFNKYEEKKDAFDGAATAMSVVAIVKKGDKSFEFPFVVFVPNKREKPVPAVVHINNRYYVPVEKALEEDMEFWPVRTFIERGYATASFHTSDVDPDEKDAYDRGVRAFLNGDREEEYSDWKCLSSWGWAASRVLDYLETLDSIDSKKVAVSGHSRGGKTSLWAAAEDTRFAIAYSNNSGCGGAALSRRAYGETVARITSAFPHWFNNTFSEYAAREDDLPVDQHELIALIAPRGVYVTSADEDLWADPRGEHMSLVKAEPVFNLLGKKALGNEVMPPLNTPVVNGQTGYHIRDGGHGLTKKDWNWFLDFADTLLK